MTYSKSQSEASALVKSDTLSDRQENTTSGELSSTCLTTQPLEPSTFTKETNANTSTTSTLTATPEVSLTHTGNASAGETLPGSSSSHTSATHPTAYSFDNQALRRRNITSTIEQPRCGHDIRVIPPGIQDDTRAPLVTPLGKQPTVAGLSESNNTSSVYSSAYPSTSSPLPGTTASVPTPTDIPEETAHSSTSQGSKEQMSVSREPNDTQEGTSSGEFSCNICFDTATSPVLTLCGHLYCWPCLHQWLEAQAQNPLCPVCKAGCEKDKVIPVYGRGKEPKDPRLTDPSVPNRPSGQRPEPRIPPRHGNNTNPFASVFENGLFGGPGFYNVHLGGAHPVAISAGLGLGLFPSLFGWQFTFPTVANTAPGEPLTTSQIQAQQAFVSRLFLMVGLLVLVSILLY
ncbi:hypothetical protein IWQ61_002637 [Dispira simplex]|nr:hypothetical protein IWQ61_002637 [Dispira simplex]